MKRLIVLAWLLCPTVMAAQTTLYQNQIRQPAGITVPTQTGGDNSAKAASTAFVQAAIAGVNPAVSVVVATTAAGDTSGLTYFNGVAGVGATLTGSINTALTFDGVTLTSLTQRVLVKNDTQSPSGAFNGVYYLTQLQTGILPPILTRALDFDQPSDINNTGLIPVQSGTVNAGRLYAVSSTVNTVGTDPVTFTQYAATSSGALVQLETHACTSVATCDFTTCISGSTYHTFRFQMYDIVPATANQILDMRFGNGGTYDSGSNYTYQNILSENAASSPSSFSAGATAFVMTSNGQGNGATVPGVSGWIEIYDPLNTARNKGWVSSLHYWDGSNSLSASNTGTGTYLAQTAVNDVRFLFASGNITSGTITCYGVTP